MLLGCPFTLIWLVNMAFLYVITFKCETISCMLIERQKRRKCIIWSSKKHYYNKNKADCIACTGQKLCVIGELEGIERIYKEVVEEESSAIITSLLAPVSVLPLTMVAVYRVPYS